MNSFFIAVQLLTIIPITHTFTATDKQLGYSSLFYPIIGLLLGGLLATSASLLSTLPIQISAALILILWVLLTGGLHLDGLADCADAWVGGLGNKKRSLEIMKDPASGPIAVAILVLLLLLKWSIICTILQQQSFYIILLTPMLGRLAILLLMQSTPYISSTGMAEKLIRNLPFKAIKIVSLFCLLTAIYYLGFLAISFMFLILLAIAYQAKKRLGGVTGDVYGAAVELVEVSVLLGAIL